MKDALPAVMDAAPAQVLGRVVSNGRSPSFGVIDFRVEPDSSVRPGQFVAVESVDEATIVLCRVSDVHEVNPHEDEMSSNLRSVLPFDTHYSREGASTVIWRVATTEPMEEAVVDGDQVIEVRTITDLPPAGAAVFAAPPAMTVALLGLEPDPDDGLWMGHVGGDPHTAVTLRKEVVQRHVLIVGGIGSGKSYTRGVLAEELRDWGVPQVNIDVNGEMIDATNELGGINLRPGRDGFTIPLSALSSGDVLDAVPSINAGTNMETLLRFAHEDLSRQVLRGDIEHFDVNTLVNHIDSCADTLEIKQKATVEPTKLRTRSLERLSFIGEPYDWPSVLTPGSIVNIDCRELTVGDLRLITASVARDLQSLARRKAIPFAVFSIDEFHLVAPSDDHAVTTQVLREIARVGRHYRMGLVLTTQSPGDVDRSVLKRLLTRFLHAIEPDQLDALKGVFSDAPPDLVRSMPKLPQGTCVLTGAFETVRHATVVQIRPRTTTHGGATPDVFGDLAERGWTVKRADADENTP